MALKSKFPMLLVLAVVSGGGALIVSKFVSGTPGFEAKVDVAVPELSATALRGEKIFASVCAKCHGNNASGTEKGPPLVHDVYNPGHHGDASFFLAVQKGVRSHHWPYGDMPPQNGVTKPQTADIVKYIRELQTANGIRYRPHSM